MDTRLDIARIDVQRDERYVLRVPVLRVGGEELDAAGLDDAAIQRWIAGLRPTPAGGSDRGDNNS